MLSPFPVHLRDSSRRNSAASTTSTPAAPVRDSPRPRVHTCSGPARHHAGRTASSTDADVAGGRGIQAIPPDHRHMSASAQPAVVPHPPTSFHFPVRRRSASTSKASTSDTPQQPIQRRPHNPFASSLPTSLLPWSTHPSYPPTHPHTRHSPGSQSQHDLGQAPSQHHRPKSSSSTAPSSAFVQAHTPATSLQVPVTSSASESQPGSSPSTAPSLLLTSDPPGPARTPTHITSNFNDARAAPFALKGPLDSPLWGLGVGVAAGLPSNTIPMPAKKHRSAVPSYSPTSQRSAAISEGEVTDREEGAFKLGGYPLPPPLPFERRASTANATPPASIAGLTLNVHGGLDRSKRHHHPFSSQEVPYPRSYERAILDLDVWDTLWLRQTCKSVTFHTFADSESTAAKQTRIPTRVLDLGCGSGTWILECASVWKECHFVGLDIVPLHPDLAHVSKDLAKRVTWVQANFLERLPFPSEEFDFVHIKRIARGVPENKWDDLFEEINRVMKPGAALEIIEEDLVFPGKTPDMDVQSENGSVHSFSMQNGNGKTWDDSRKDSFRSEDNGTGIGKENASVEEGAGASVAGGNGKAGAGVFEGLRRAVSVGSKDTLPRLSSSSGSSSTTASAADVLMYAEKSVGHWKVQEGYPVVRSRSLNLSSRVHIQDLSCADGESATAVASFEPTSPLAGRRKSSKRPSTASTVSTSYSSSSRLSGPQKGKTNAAAQAVLMEAATPLYMMTPYPGVRMAAAGYGPPRGKGGMKSKLSLDGGKSGEGMQGSGGTKVGFPCGANVNSTTGPTFDGTGERVGDPRDHSVLERIYNEMHAERFVNLSPLSLLANALGVWFKDVRTHPPIVFRFPAARGWGMSMLSTQELLRGTSPYAMVDDARLSAFSRTQGDVWERLEVDLRTLNVHLTLRVKEVLGCAEAMWESCQKRGGRGELSRAEFDELLARFDLDMSEHVALGSALQDRLHWSIARGPTPEHKRMFDAACNAHIRNNPAQTRPPPPPPSSRLSRSIRVFVASKAAA